MSVENAKEFLHMLDRNPEIKQKLNSTDGRGRMKAAELLGLPFNNEELLKAVREILKPFTSIGELSDSQLEAVAGGVQVSSESLTYVIDTFDGIKDALPPGIKNFLQG